MFLVAAVYCTHAAMSSKNIRCEFSFETDISWIDFKSRACAQLDIAVAGAQLGYRVIGLEGPRTPCGELATSEHFDRALCCIIERLSRARSKVYGIKVVDLVSLLLSCLWFSVIESMLESSASYTSFQVQEAQLL